MDGLQGRGGRGSWDDNGGGSDGGGADQPGSQPAVQDIAVGRGEAHGERTARLLAGEFIFYEVGTLWALMSCSDRSQCGCHMVGPPCLLIAVGE